MRTPYQLTLPCRWSAVVDDEPGALLADIQNSMDGKDFFAEEWNKLMLSLVGMQERTLFLTSAYFVQRFRHSLKDVLTANGLTLKADRQMKPIFGGAYE